MLFFYLSLIDNEDDRISFQKIYLAYSDEIFRRILPMMHNQTDAQDVMQETWIAVLKHLSVLRGKDEACVKAYVMKIARNKAISMLRKKKAENKFTCDEDCAEIADESDFFTMFESQSIENIAKCIDKLDEKYSDVLKLRYLYEHSLKEIAQLMNVSVNVVSIRLKRGKAMLMNILKQESIL